jgi:glutamate---cysteine ligase / carboxylate-amine ligase
MGTPTLAYEPPHRFGVGPSLAVGAEEELLLVDPGTLALSHGWPDGLRAAPFSVGHACPEVCDAMVELVTPVCARAADVGDVLCLLRDEAYRRGAMLLGAGVHPDGGFGDVRPGDGERHRSMMAQLKGLVGRTPYCGLHVHVGLPDPETAIRACNGMRKWIPLLQALGANSPFWHGRDSGLASARIALLRSLPRTGAPRPFRDFDDFEQCVDALLSAGALDDYTAVWWDVRPHPRLGTLEVRAADTQTSVRDAVALTALTHCLVVHEAEHSRCAGPPSEAVEESSFRAFRDGLGATLWFEDAMRPIPELARLALRRADAAARALGCRDELTEVTRLVREGNGAERQRRMHARGGMPALLRGLARDTHPGGATVIPLPARALQQA